MSRIPWARRQQEGSNGDDDGLTQLAQVRRPKVRHWWGRRHWYEDVRTTRPSQYAIEVGPGEYSEYRNGAWCYLCMSPIASWSSRWPMTAQARAAVQRHRTQHLQGRLDTAPMQETER